jgi:hypothetical protein
MWAVTKSNLDLHTATLLEWPLGRIADLDQDHKEQVREYIRRNSVDLGERILFTEREMVVIVSPSSKTEA